MHNLQIFHNEDFGRVRVILDEEGAPWFVAADVCAALGINNVSQAVSYLDDDENNSIIINDGTPGSPVRTIISEPGLYSLILRSRKPEAKTFKRWVTHEVIPAIRKTGQYKIHRSLQSSEFVDLLAYVRTLRQMANREFYPPRMRAEFLAEAASLLSGYPTERFMPPESTFYPLFN